MIWDNHWIIDNTKDAIDDLRKDIGASLVGSIFSYMGIKIFFQVYFIYYS